MILQDHPKLIAPIRESGCGFLSIIWHAVRLRKLLISDVDYINTLYGKIVPMGYMNEKCFIHDWEGVFRECKLPVKYTQRHEDPERVCAKGEIEILRYPGHFVAGNGQGVVTYDSYGESNAVANHPLHSKRIFKVL